MIYNLPLVICKFKPNWFVVGSTNRRVVFTIGVVVRV